MLDKAALTELQSLQRDGVRLSPAQVVAQARSANSALHRFFTWDDSEAAQQFRIIQAKQVIKAVVRFAPSRRVIAVHAVVRHSATPSPAPERFVAPSLDGSAQQAAIRRLMGDVKGLWPEYERVTGMDAVFSEVQALLQAKLRPINNFGGASRDGNGSLSRFKPYTHAEAHTDQEKAALPVGHPALVEARTLFPSRVFGAEDGEHVLVPGHNNAKVGDFVSKGPWKGMNIFTLTLEERATCPTTCFHWQSCYGNAMPLAKRRKYDAELMQRLDEELKEKAAAHPVGFVVRLHILGDFPDEKYVTRWIQWLDQHPQLHIFGYTGHPRRSDIGNSIWAMNELCPDRCAIRFSVAPDVEHDEMQATTIWRKERGMQIEGLVCPASSDDTEACGTCGLCWSPAMEGTRIVFLGHGMNRQGRAKDQEPAEPVARTKDGAVSIAGLEERDALADAVPVTVAEAVNWATQHAKAALQPGLPGGRIGAINRARAAFGLPAFVISAPRPGAIPLPSASTGTR